VELLGFLIKGFHGHGEVIIVRPEGTEGALGHDDDEGPALRMVAHGLRKADLGLSHAFGTALATAVQKQDDGPFAVVVSPPFLRHVDLVAMDYPGKDELAIEEARVLDGGGTGGAGAGEMDGL